MTAETDLLPLPEGYAAWYYIGSTHVYSADEMESYARANVAHATASKEAEIEALRAEVERLNRILGRIVACDGDSNLTIRAGTDAFAAAREYLRPNT